jgi:phosphinothricin acetyltransferase
MPLETPMPLIRPATPADAASLLEIYRPYVEGTAVSFETELPSVETFAARIDKALQGWAWLVAEVDGQCVGYAYGGAHRERAAYRWSTETSAYIRAGWQGKGLGRMLYQALFERLAERGCCNALAVVVVPNDASVALHRAVGFETVGVFKRGGHKFGAWHDVMWLQRVLRDFPPHEAGGATTGQS